jgi:hypothetical protein
MKFLFLCLFALPALAQAATWQSQAINLSNAEYRPAAIAKLKKQKFLTQKLQAALTSNDPEEWSLAIETIGALKLAKFAPDLVSFAVRDFSGRSLQVLLKLDPQGKNPEVKKFYDHLPAALRELDPRQMLAALGQAPGLSEAVENDIDFWLHQESHGVRIAAVRRVMDQADVSSFLVTKALMAEPYQVRETALWKLSEAKDLSAEVHEVVHKHCQIEKRSEVLEACKALGEGQ